MKFVNDKHVYNRRINRPHSYSAKSSGTDNNFNWNRDITEVAKINLGNKFTRDHMYLTNPGFITNPTLFEYWFMHGMFGLLAWNIVNTK